MSRSGIRPLEPVFDHPKKMGSIDTGNTPAGAPFVDPTSLPDLAWWLDASDTSTINQPGSSVVGWTDKSGNGRDVTNGTQIGPVSGSHTQNGLNVLQFNGGQSLTRAPFWYALGAFTLFVVFDVDSDPSATIRTLLAESDSTGNTNEFSLRYTSTQIEGALVEASSVRYVVQDGDPTDGTPHVALLRDDLTTAEVSLDGGTPVSAGYTRAGTFTTDILNIGRLTVTGPSNGRLHHGFIADIIMYDRILGVSEIDAVFDYVEGKWGL